MIVRKVQEMLLENKQRLKANSKVSALVTYTHGHQNIEISSCQHCGKTEHKEDSYWKKYPELIPDQYKSEKKEAPLTPLKKALSVSKKRLY